MPGPSLTWNTKRVFITYRNLLTGSKEAGTWEASATGRITNTLADGTRQVFRAGKVGSGVLNVTDGLPSLDFDLPIVDDPDNSPNGGEITLVITFASGGSETFHLSPLNTWPDEGTDLSLILDPAIVTSAPPLNVKGIPGGVAALDTDGDVVDAAGRKLTAPAPVVPPAKTFINVKDHGATGNGTTDDLAALNAARDAALTAGLPLYLPKGTYRVSAALDWRKQSLHAYGDGRNVSVIRQTGINQPVVRLGEQHQHIHDLSFQYSAQAAVGHTASVAIELYKPSYCVYERLTTFWAHKGIGFFQGDYNSLTDTGGGNWHFSNTWSDIEVLGFRSKGIDLTAWNRASTGSVWNNIYVRNGPVGPIESSSSYPVHIKGCDEQVFNQLNIEGVTLPSSDAFMSEGSSVVVNGLHFEGVTVGQWDGGLIQAYAAGNTQINMVTIQNDTFVADMNSKSIVKVGSNARVRLQGLTVRNTNTIQSTTFVLMQSLDQTGSFAGTEIDMSYFTAPTFGDGGTVKVAKQINYP
jgi:hypothetical protein